MEEVNIESTNIHSKWLENIYNQFMKIQEMEILALEGCSSLSEYLSIPYEMSLVLLPEIQYKNLKFLVREINLLIDNLSPILKNNLIPYKERIKPVLDNLDRRHIFMKDIKKDNQVIQIMLLPFFRKTLDYTLNLKSDLIRDDKIMRILYLEEDTNKKW